MHCLYVFTIYTLRGVYEKNKTKKACDSLAKKNGQDLFFYFLAQLNLPFTVFIYFMYTLFLSLFFLALIIIPRNKINIGQIFVNGPI